MVIPARQRAAALPWQLTAANVPSCHLITEKDLENHDNG